MSSECSNPRPVCDLQSRVCVECDGDSDCAGGPGRLCEQTGPLAGSCLACTALDSTACTSESVCDPDTGTCVACLEDADCAKPGEPRCDTALHICAPCGGDFGLDVPLACLDPSLPACQTSGVRVGECTECSGTNASRCELDKPVCRLDEARCGCLADTDCGSATSGRVCEEACRDGCRAFAGNGCAMGMVCTSADDHPGSCVLPDAGQASDGGVWGDASIAYPDAAPAHDGGEKVDATIARPDAAFANDGGEELDAAIVQADAADPGAHDSGGCACGSAGTPLGTFALLGVFALRRRRLA